MGSGCSRSAAGWQTYPDGYPASVPTATQSEVRKPDFRRRESQGRRRRCLQDGRYPNPQIILPSVGLTPVKNPARNTSRRQRYRR